MNIKLEWASFFKIIIHSIATIAFTRNALVTLTGELWRSKKRNPLQLWLQSHKSISLLLAEATTEAVKLVKLASVWADVQQPWSIDVITRQLQRLKDWSEPGWHQPVRTRRFWSELATAWAFPCSSTAGPVCRCWNGSLCLRLRSWRGRWCTPWWQAGKTLRETLRLLASPLCPSLPCCWEKENDMLWMRIQQTSCCPHQSRRWKYPPQTSLMLLKIEWRISVCNLPLWHFSRSLGLVGRGSIFCWARCTLWRCLRSVLRAVALQACVPKWRVRAWFGWGHSPQTLGDWGGRGRSAADLGGLGRGGRALRSWGDAGRAGRLGGGRRGGQNWAALGQKRAIQRLLRQVWSCKRLRMTRD